MATALKLRSDIKKLKKAIDTKGISAAIKVKLRNQLEKAENELASMQKGGKPRKVSTTKGTATTLTALQKLIKRKKYGVYQGKGVDLKKDAGEGAKATGRRVSKGLKANQFGSKGQNKGNVYYEYRPNRIDVKQPSKKAKYPKLEKGGELEEQTVYLQVKPRFYDELKEKADKDNIHLEFIEDNEDGYEVYRAEMTKNQLSDFKKEIPFTYSFDYKYAKGGMTATKANVIFKQYERNEGRNDHSENVVLLAKHFGSKEDLQLAQSIQKKHDSLGHMPPDLMKQRDELSDKLYPMLVAAKKKVNGVMAQGGQTDGKNGYVAFYKGKRIEVYADTKYEAQLKAAKIFNAKKSYDVNVALAEVDGEQHYNSTMMAKGGGIYSSDSMYVLTVLKDGKEVGTERFRAKNIKEAIEIGEEYEEKYKMKFGDMLNFKVSEAMERGGYNTGASWSIDRARHNKSEDYEIPMNKRKLEDGGVISKTHRIG